MSATAKTPEASRFQRPPEPPLTARPPAVARRLQLSNGLRLLHVPQAHSPVVGLALVFDVGSRHERPEQRGLSHLLEHMVFAGSVRWTEAELRDQIALRGGFFNGLTTQEQTSYLVALPAGELRAGLDYLGQLCFAPTLTAAALDRERRIIEDEAGPPDWADWAWRIAWRRWLVRQRVVSSVGELADQLLDREPAQWDPVIGYPWTRRTLTLADVRAHHRRFYLPANAWLVIVGGGSTRTVAEHVQRVLGGVPRRPAAPPPPPAPDPIGRGRRFRFPLVRLRPEQVTLVLLPFAGARDPDWPAMGMARSLIHELLRQRLRTELGLVYHVHVNGATGREQGFSQISVVVPARERERVEREVLACLDRLQAGEVDPVVWDRVSRQSRGAWALTRADSADYLAWLAENAAILERHPAGPWGLYPTLPELSEIKRVLKRLLARENRIVIVHQPSWPITLAAGLALWLAGTGVILALISWLKLLGVRF